MKCKLAPLPSPGSAEAWSFKQAGIAAMGFMLAATSQGLATHAMEGLDARRVREALGVPRAQAARWGVPLVVAIGYARESTHPAAGLRSVRPPLGEVAFSNRFGAQRRLF